MVTGDPERVVHRVHSPRRSWRPILGFVAFIWIFIGLEPGRAHLVGLAALLALGIFWLETAVPIRLEIGSEGVTFARFGRRRFVPCRSIASVQVREREVGGAESGGWRVQLSVVFTLADGETIEVATGIDVVEGRDHVFGRVGSFGATDKASRDIVRAVRERLARLRAHDAAPLEQSLARGGRPVDAWLSGLAQLADPGADAYRAVAIDKESLWSILEDPGASPSARAGAALVLRRMVEPSDAPRVRVAVEGCQAPELRLVVERAFDGEGEGVEHDALESIA